MKSSRRARGFTLIEVIIAGAIMMVGLMGVTMMLLRGATNTRNGVEFITASNLGNDALQEIQNQGFDSLVATATSGDGGASMTDGGTVKDPTGRLYTKTYRIVKTPLAYPTYTIDVTVAYKDGSGQTQSITYSGIMSKAPDAG